MKHNILLFGMLCLGGLLGATSSMAEDNDNYNFADTQTDTIAAFQKAHVAELVSQVTVERDIVFAETPEKTLLLDVYPPPNRGEGPLPAIVWIHGGGLRGLDKDYDVIRWCAAHTALQGYVAVSIDYRLVTEAPLPAAIEDCKTAVRFIRHHAEEYGIDPERIAVAGESSGGYLASFVTFTSGTEHFQTEDWADASDAVNCGVLWYPHTDRGEFIDPVDYITSEAPPALLIHGDYDSIVPLEESFKILNRCVEHAVPASLYIIANADHGFYDRNADAAAYRRHMEEALRVSVEFVKARFGE